VHRDCISNAKPCLLQYIKGLLHELTPHARGIKLNLAAALFQIRVSSKKLIQRCRIWSARTWVRPWWRRTVAA
jgi:hypothetical protein